MFDFLAQAGFWQWLGIICLTGVSLHGVAAIIAAMWGHKP